MICICPNCKTDAYRSLKDGKFCRSCGKRVHKVLGEWWSPETYKGIDSLINRMVLLLADRYGTYEMKEVDVRKEKRAAALLIRDCGYDLDVAFYVLGEAIHLLKDFSTIFQTKWTLNGKTYSERIARARRVTDKTRAKQQEQRKAARIAEQRGDLFSEQNGGMDAPAGPKHHSPGREG